MWVSLCWGEGREEKIERQTTKEEVDEVIILKKGGDLRVTSFSSLQNSDQLILSPKKKKIIIK